MIKANYYIRIVNPDDDWQRIDDAKPLVLEAYPGLDLFIHFTEDREGGFHAVSEAKTGTLIAGGDTESEAIDLAESRLGKCRASGRSLECQIKKHINKYGVSPRYEA